MKGCDEAVRVFEASGASRLPFQIAWRDPPITILYTYSPLRTRLAMFASAAANVRLRDYRAPVSDQSIQGCTLSPPPPARLAAPVTKPALQVSDPLKLGTS